MWRLPRASTALPARSGGGTALRRHWLASSCPRAAGGSFSWNVLLRPYYTARGGGHVSSSFTITNHNNNEMPSLRHQPLAWSSLSTQAGQESDRPNPTTPHGEQEQPSEQHHDHHHDHHHHHHPPLPDSAAENSKFPLPNKEREMELSRIQADVQQHYRNGDFRRALKASQQLLKETEEHFGRDHPATASAYNNVGLVQKQLGNFDEARQSYLAAMKVYKTTVGADHASYASILHNLGNLNRSQIHFDASLKATDRLTLVEQAQEYLETAYKIRVDEMGADHPHTVASRSSWGSTIATQILHHHKMMSSSSSSPSSGGRQRPYVPLLSQEVTQQAWEAAEVHLREALQTAIDKPRGPGLPKRKAKRKNVAAPTEPTQNKVETLSAASAAQNLAVFLKTRATTETPYNDAWLHESKSLYQSALAVRSKLLPKDHPDLYATKFSLGELLETMGDEEAANQIRQEIVDTYDPPSAAATAEKAPPQTPVTT